MPPKFTITITLKSHPRHPLPTGFDPKTHTLELNQVNWGDDLNRHLVNLNQFRQKPITHLYNPMGQELPITRWKDFKLNTDITFYVDQP